MVADNKDLASDKEVTSAKTGGKNPITISTIAAGPQNHKKIFSLLVVALVGICLVIVGLYGNSNREVYAKVGNHKIYKKDVKNLIGNAKNITDNQAATVLADKYLVEAMAKEQDITVTDKDIEEAYGPLIKEQRIHNKYSYQLQVNQLYFNKLQTHNSGIYKGWVLVAQFSRYIELQPLTAAQKKAEPNKGNAQAIAKDRKYAQDLITNLHKQINTRELTFEQAAQIERNDPVVGQGAYPTLSHSSTFDTSLGMISLFQPEAVRKEINKLKAGQTSKPFVVSVANSIDPAYKKTFDSYFLVIHMDTKSGGTSTISFSQQVVEAKQKLGYKVYV